MESRGLHLQRVSLKTRKRICCRCSYWKPRHFERFDTNSRNIYIPIQTIHSIYPTTNYCQLEQGSSKTVKLTLAKICLLLCGRRLRTEWKIVSTDGGSRLRPTIYSAAMLRLDLRAEITYPLQGIKNYRMQQHKLLYIVDGDYPN